MLSLVRDTKKRDMFWRVKSLKDSHDSNFKN